MSPIKARSRSPTMLAVSMLSISERASPGSSTGVCPDVTRREHRGFEPIAAIFRREPDPPRLPASIAD
jgi:hypothetical protein